MTLPEVITLGEAIVPVYRYLMVETTTVLTAGAAQIIPLATASDSS